MYPVEALLSKLSKAPQECETESTTDKKKKKKKHEAVIVITILGAEATKR